MEKWDKTTISGHSRRPVSVQVRAVPVQFGFWSFFVNLYRYRCGKGAVHASRTEPVPVQVRPILVHPALFLPVFVF